MMPSSLRWTRIALWSLALAASLQSLLPAQDGAVARRQVEKELTRLVQKLGPGGGSGSVDLSKSEEVARIRAIDGHLDALHETMGALFDDDTIRLVAIEVVATIGDPTSVYPLLLILNDPNERPGIRRKAIDAVVRSGDRRAVMPLVEAIAQPDEKARAGDREIEFDRWRDVKRRAAEALPRFENPEVVIDRLVRLLTEEVDSPSTLESAALALGLLKSERAVPDLKRLLRIEGLDPAARREALLALGRIGSTEAMPELEAGLEDPDTAVRMEAVNAIAFMGPKGERLAGRLVETFRDDSADLYVRASIPGALVRIAPASTEVAGALVAMLGRKLEGLSEFEDPRLLHVASMVALQFAAPAAAVPALLERHEDADPEVRETVQGLLVRITKSAFETDPKSVPGTISGWNEWWRSAGKAFYER